MRTCRFRFSALSSDVVVYNRQRDHRITFRRKPSLEKGIQVAQRATFFSVAVSHSTLQREEGGKLRCQWRDEAEVGTCFAGAHRHTSSSEMATARSPAKSTRAYPYVVCVDAWPSTSAMALRGRPEASSPVASVW